MVDLWDETAQKEVNLVRSTTATPSISSTSQESFGNIERNPLGVTGAGAGHIAPYPQHSSMNMYGQPPPPVNYGQNPYSQGKHPEPHIKIHPAHADTACEEGRRASLTYRQCHTTSLRRRAMRHNNSRTLLNLTMAWFHPRAPEDVTYHRMAHLRCSITQWQWDIGCHTRATASRRGCSPEILLGVWLRAHSA